MKGFYLLDLECARLISFIFCHQQEFDTIFTLHINKKQNNFVCFIFKKKTAVFYIEFAFLHLIFKDLMQNLLTMLFSKAEVVSV